jgi:multisubunit Na+/H+ antiporter MnhB subunit
MKMWLRRIRGAIGMGLTWAVTWAVGGVLIGVASRVLPGLPWDRFFEVFDAPLPALAIPGFLGGVIFSVVLGIAGRRRGFEELSLRRFAVWGAVGGLLLSLVPAALVLLGLATPGPSSGGLWELTAMISVPLILLSTVSACGSLMVARAADGRRPLEAGASEGAIEALPAHPDNAVRHPAPAPRRR